MVSLSKLLDQGLKDAKCFEVFHPGQTCYEFQFGYAGTYLAKCMKYFLPIVTVPLILKGKDIRKKHVRDALSYYVELIVTGSLIAQTVPIAQCGLRGLIGKFTKCSFMFLPMIIPTWTVCFVSAKVARLFASSIFQVTLEAALRNSRNPMCRTLCRSKTIQALMFMTCSAFVLHGLRNYNVKVFWIVKSIPSEIEKDNYKCPHDGKCSSIWLKDLAKNICIGLSIDLFKSFIGSVARNKSFLKEFGTKLLHMNFPTTFFLSSYSCIYRMTSCLLNRTTKYNTELKHITAAYLGGISFFLLPKLTILCYAISVSIEIGWKIFERRKFENQVKYIEKFKQIPFHRIYTCIATGYLVHMYVFRPEVLSPMGLAIVSALTGDRAPGMKADVYKYFRSIQQDK